MLEFNYLAKNRDGSKLKGAIEAADAHQAAKILQEKGYVVMSVQAKTETVVTTLKRRFFSRIGLKDLVNFTRQFSTMINSGLAITDSLSILKAQSENPSLAKIIDDILQEIQSGSGLSEAMGKHRIFDKIFIALVRAGETAGMLDKVLLRLADNLEKKREFTGKVKGAMLYPIIIVIGMVLLATVMMVFVFPKLMSLYSEFQAELPWPTLLVMGLSNLMTKFWWLVLVLAGGAIYGVNFLLKTPAGGLWVDRFLLKMPIIGKLRQFMMLTEFTRTLGLLVGAGVLIVDALNVLVGSFNSLVYKNALKQVVRRVEKGSSLAVSLAQTEVFPPLLSQMVSVGEESGKLEEVLLKVANYFQQESEVMVSVLTTALEPLIMVVLGLGVGFLIVSVIMPIYNLTSQF